MQWHRVSDRLPDDETIVVIYLPDHPNVPIWLGYREDGTWWDIVGVRLYPTHWAELPAPPED